MFVASYRNKIERARIFGVPVDNVDMAQALKLVDELIKNDQKGRYILSVNPEKVIALQNDSFLKLRFSTSLSSHVTFLESFSLLILFLNILSISEELSMP